MNHYLTKSRIVFICLGLSFVRGIFLSFIKDDSNANIIINLTFGALVLLLCKRWFELDAHQHLPEAEANGWRYNFIRDVLLYPLYFRRTRGSEALVPTLWCTGVLILF